MHLMVLGASRPCPVTLITSPPEVSMHLMVLGASRRRCQVRHQYDRTRLNAPDGAGCFPTMRAVPGRIRKHLRLNAPDGAGCFPTPRRVVRCPAWGNGPRIATGPKAPLGPGRTSLIKPDFAQFSQGSPPTGLQGLRATRSRRGHADPGVSLSKFSDNEAEMQVTRPGSRYYGYRTYELLCRAAAHLTRSERSCEHLDRQAEPWQAPPFGGARGKRRRIGSSASDCTRFGACSTEVLTSRMTGARRTPTPSTTAQHPGRRCREHGTTCSRGTPATATSRRRAERLCGIPTVS